MMVHNLSQSLAIELKNSNVKVISATPGFVSTGLIGFRKDIFDISP
jgi:short-subunit dehydrogenase